MKLSQLLKARSLLLRQAGLANLAFAYQLLDAFAGRIARACLTGRVRLQAADPDEDRYTATLTALDGRQSVLEEHFVEEELDDLVDALAVASDQPAIDLTFKLEDFAARHVAPLRVALEEAGIEFEPTPPRLVERAPETR